MAAASIFDIGFSAKHILPFSYRKQTSTKDCELNRVNSILRYESKRDHRRSAAYSETLPHPLCRYTNAMPHSLHCLLPRVDKRRSESNVLHHCRIVALVPRAILHTGSQ